MLASLASAGVSQLYNLLQSQVRGDTTVASAAAPTSTSTSPSSGGSSFNTALNQLVSDIQSGASATSGTGNAATTSTDPTTAVSSDLQTVFTDLQKAAGGHSHHHHHHGADTASPQSSSPSQTPGAPASSNPFGSLASSLLAYANASGLTSTQSASTSLTA